MRARFFLPVIVLITSLFLLQALICNFASVEGVDLALTREKIKEVEKENHLLEMEIVTVSSLARVASVVAELGFSSAKVAYTSFELPVAMGK